MEIIYLHMKFICHLCEMKTIMKLRWNNPRKYLCVRIGEKWHNSVYSCGKERQYNCTTVVWRIGGGTTACTIVVWKGNKIGSTTLPIHSG